MENQDEIISAENLRYNAFHREVKNIFGGRIDRITINTGMTCPNIDGTKAKNGCTFCQDASYWGLSLLKKENPSITEQINRAKTYLKERYPSSIGYFAYFQNGTNTYEKPDVLKKVYNEALQSSGMVGVMIATRPDCIDEKIADVLSEINEKTWLWVELGMPSHRDDRNKKLNRAHTAKDFENAVKLLHDRKIKICAHVMHGLPDEKRDEMIDKARYFNSFPIDAVKIHNLIVFTDTVLERHFHDGHFTPLELDEYKKWCVDFLEHLRPDILIQRLGAHGPRRVTVTPQWSVNKWNVINAVHEELESRNTWQGKFFEK